MRVYRLSWSLASALVALLLLGLILPAQMATAANCGPNVTHTVSRGENLYRISLRYGTTMQAIAGANGIANYDRIYAGQQLRIPCAGGASGASGAPGGVATDDPLLDANGVLPPVFVTPDVELAPIVVNCGGLRPVSPGSGLAATENTFYWNPVPGATSYRVNVYNQDLTPGRRVATFDAPGNSSSVVGNIARRLTGEGFVYSWEVQALVSDIVVCTSRRLTMLREFEPFGPSNEEDKDD